MEEKKKRAISDLRRIIYSSAAIMSQGAMEVLTALCLGGIRKDEAVKALLNCTKDCTTYRIKAQEWWAENQPQAVGFVRKYDREIILDHECEAARIIDMYQGESDMTVDLKVPIRTLYWVAKKILWQGKFRDKLCLYDYDWNKCMIQTLRVYFINTTRYTELYRGRKKSQRYTVSRDKDKPAFYISSTGRLGKLPLYKLEKYMKENKIVLDHDELRATVEISDGQYVKIGSFIERHMPKLPRETKEMLQRAFEEIKPCRMVIDRDFKKAYDPSYDNHQDTDGDKASNYSCMSGQGDAAQEFYGGIHGCKIVRFETDNGEQVGRCIMYEYKGQRHFIRIYGLYDYHRTMINLLNEEMKDGDLFGRNECIDGMKLETDWTEETRTMYLDGNRYGVSRIEDEDGYKYVVCTDYEWDCETTSNDTLEYEFDGDYNTCDNCGGRCDEDYEIWVNDHCYCCSDCAREAGYAYCERCCDWAWEEDGIWIDGEFYCCDDCAWDAGYAKCESCDEWHEKSKMIECYGEWYCCEDCANDNGWFVCPHCGDWFHESNVDVANIDDGLYCCDECAERDGWVKDGEEWKRKEDVEEVKEQEPEEPKEVSNEG